MYEKDIPQVCQPKRQINVMNALAAWCSGHPIRQRNRLWIQISPGCKFLRTFYIAMLLIVTLNALLPGLPDFSWHKITKREKIPNYHKLCQMSITYNKRP
jgi:hypothetical protein